MLSLRAVMNPTTEARRSRRYRCYGPVRFRILTWQITGKLINLSLEGCQIRPTRNLELAAGDEFELRFSVNDLLFHAHCVVRWAGDDHRLGVEILRISERGRVQLLDLLRELAAAEATTRGVR